jgi:hypothetical protein
MFPYLHQNLLNLAMLFWQEYNMPEIGGNLEASPPINVIIWRSKGFLWWLIKDGILSKTM